jgi:transcription elongation factor GreA
MNMSKTPMTVLGAKMLREELERLKTIERPRITAAIAEAREHGDLKENAEYHAAREEQGICEAHINDMEGKLATAEIIDVTKLPASDDKKVVFGATVTVEKDNGDQITYKIVGEDEADIEHGLICYKTPIAKGLMGKYTDDDVVIVTPKGKVNYYVVKVQYI